MHIISPRYLEALYNGGVQALLEQLTRDEQHPLANSSYNTEHAIGNTTRQQLDDLKGYLDSILNRIYNLDIIEEKSLQSMVDELHGLNKHSTVAILDCILTGLRRIRSLIQKFLIIMSSIDSHGLTESSRITMVFRDKGSSLHYDTHGGKLLLQVAAPASGYVQENAETGSLEIRITCQMRDNTR